MGAKVYLKSGYIIEYENITNVFRRKDGTITIEYIDKGEKKVSCILLRKYCWV